VPIIEEIKNLKIFKNDDNNNNILINGDNFYALNVLNFTHKQKIDLIYIDPPYNTGNNDFIYNDRFVNNEDGYKHSKWLSFMEKRLLLTLDLLNDGGLIFISIDAHEFAQLKLLCDQIFGEHNFVENFIWVKNSTKNNSKTTSTNHEYILCYSKNIQNIRLNADYFRIKKPGFDEVMKLIKKEKALKTSPKDVEKKLDLLYKQNLEWKGIKSYCFVDADYNVYCPGDASSPGNVGKFYDITHPITNKVCKTPTNGWRYTKQTMDSLLKDNLIVFGKDETKVPLFKRILSKNKYEVMKSIIIDNKDGRVELQKIFQGGYKVWLSQTNHFNNQIN
ncbi:MAG: site-specific DNA-methyltransferase, partial [Mycoplasma sp.]|nr:site-specific DNA-methyltransferase [Mycoplasma sp.]